MKGYKMAYRYAKSSRYENLQKAECFIQLEDKGRCLLHHHLLQKIFDQKGRKFPFRVKMKANDFNDTQKVEKKRAEPRTQNGRSFLLKTTLKANDFNEVSQ